MYLMRLGPAGAERPVVRIDDTTTSTSRTWSPTSTRPSSAAAD